MNEKEPQIIQIIPLRKGPWGNVLTYFSLQKVQIGDVVKIAIKNQKLYGIVSEVRALSGLKTEIKNQKFILKKILEVKENSFFKKEFIQTIIIFGEYSFFRKNDLFDYFMPLVFKKNYDLFLDILKMQKKLTDNYFLNKSEKLLLQDKEENRFDFYKNLIRTSFSKKESVFILVPNAFEADKVKFYIQKGIENFVYSFHGSLKEKELKGQIEKVLKEEHPVCVIATVSFLALPINAKVFILEKENSNLYKYIQNKNLNLKNLIEIYTEKLKAKFILADDILSIDSLAKKDLVGWDFVRHPSFRVFFDGDLEVVDKEKNTHQKGRFFSDKSIKEIQNFLEKDKKIFIFSLRKGLATKTICNDCREEILCPKCKIPLTLYESKDKTKRMFVCNKCQEKKDINNRCENCGSWNLISFGLGTDKIVEELKFFFPKEKILQIDKQIIKSESEANKVFKDFSNTKRAILIGTEMVFFYLKDKIDLSIVFSFDSLWSMPNFRIREKIIQIILNTIFLTKEKVLIETKNPEDNILHDFVSKNLSQTLNQELMDRKNMQYPPYFVFIKIKKEGIKENLVNERKFLEDFFEKENKNIYLSFVKGDIYNLNCLLKIESKRWLPEEILISAKKDKELEEKLHFLIQNDYEIIVDPENLF